MPKYRMAVRRTQAQVDASRKTNKAVESLDYRQLQELAKERGISPRQSADALREQLA